MKIPVIVFITTTIVGLGIASFFFVNNRTLKQELASLEGEKTEVETELTILKNTDLAKEVKLLQTQLNRAERSLAEKERDLASANNRLRTYEINRGEITSYLDAIEAVSRNYWHYTLTEPILDTIEAKVKALRDNEILSLWIVARKQTTPNSANPSAVWDVVGRMLARVRNLLP